MWCGVAGRRGIRVVDHGIHDRACLELDGDRADDPVEVIPGDPNVALEAPARPVDHGAIVREDDPWPRGPAV
jgi:hypothetical protein